MIKIMFKPFFKKFFGLFISMVFVSMLAVGLLTCFGSSIINVRNNYHEFVLECQDMDEQITTNFTSRETLINTVKNIDGVKTVEARLTIDCYLQKEERTIVARVFSYNENNAKIFNYEPCVIDRIERSETLPNIGISDKYARNNDFKLGQTLKLGFYEQYQEFYVSEIVSTPEAMYPRANNYVWSDNYDFGYVYCSDSELAKGLNSIVSKIKAEINNDELYKIMIEQAMAVAGITIPQIDLIDESFVSQFANQLIIKNVDGAVDDVVLEACETALKNTTDPFSSPNKIEVRSSTVKAFMPHIAYMERSLAQIQIVSIFLPVFFYTVTMIVVGLFLVQIIKTMTSQIGIFMSIGIDTREITRLFLFYTTVVGIASSLLGVPLGFGLNTFIASLMKRSYSIPAISPLLNIWVTIVAIVGLFLFLIATTFIATRAILTITPKDATISNEAIRKPLPKPVAKLIDKAPVNIKLGTNAIFQNPRRFFVSTFSIFASLLLILLSTLFFVSKEEMIDQSVNRRLDFTCQVYLTAKDEEFGEELSSQPFVMAFENCYYAYLKVDTKTDEKVYLECLAIDEGVNEIINIPDQSGYGNIPVPKEGLILPSALANQLSVNEGDFITINDKSVEIKEISYQYLHPITYLNKQQLKDITDSYVSSFVLDVSDDNAFLSYLSKNQNQCLTVFTKSLSQGLKNIFDSINVMVFIMVGFSIGMAFIILIIMGQNALLEQRRQLNVYRAIGFNIVDISNIWTLQSVSQLIISTILGLPVGALSVYLLLQLASSPAQTYPFIFSWPMVFMAIGFILLVIIACHSLSMISIAKWNIADNTRSRE